MPTTRASGLLVSCLLLCAAATASAQHPGPRWVYQGIEDINAMASLPDLDGDRVPEVVVETYDSGAGTTVPHLFALSAGAAGAPPPIWGVRPVGGPSNSGGDGDYCLEVCPDLNADGFPDVLLGTAWGGRSVHAINGRTGATLWSFNTYNEPYSGWVYSLHAHPDRTGDGVPEVLAGCGSDNNQGYLFNGATGQVIWRFTGAADAILNSLSLPDVNADGVADVLFAAGDNDYNAYAVSGAGAGTAARIWAANSGGSNWACVLGSDVNGDGRRDPVVGCWRTADQVRCLDARTGALVWRATVDYVMRLATLTDVDGDGAREIVVGSWSNWIDVLSGRTGARLWRAYGGTLNGGDFWAVESVKDVTGDGIEEVVGGCFDTKVYLFDGATGAQLWTWTTGNRVFSVRPGWDVTGNNYAEVLAGTQFLNGSGGKLYLLEAHDAWSQVGGRPAVAGAAAAVPGPAVDLAWTSSAPLPYRVYARVATADPAARDELREAVARGELRAADAVERIVADAEPAPVARTEVPLAPAGAAGAGWTYSFRDLPAAGEDASRLRYEIVAVLPDGQEQTVLHLAPAAATAVPDRPLLDVSLAPNPFNPATTLRMALAGPARVTIAVRDARGRLVARLPAFDAEAGVREIRWDARDGRGRALPAGAYLLTVEAAGQARTLRAVVVK